MWNRHSALNDFGNCAAPLALGLYFGTFDLGRCPRLVWAGPLARVTLCAGRTTPVHVKKLQTSQRCNREELALLKRAARIVVMLPDEQATPEQVALLRRMTPEGRFSPSGLKRALQMMPSCWNGAVRIRPVCVSHTRTALSGKPVSNLWPSGLN